jgi:hypothetical protein
MLLFSSDPVISKLITFPGRGEDIVPSEARERISQPNTASRSTCEEDSNALVIAVVVLKTNI